MNKHDDFFREINEIPQAYTAATISARMIDGLGFRYYWATEGLQDKNFDYKNSNDARSIGETVNHIYGLTQVICKSMGLDFIAVPDSDNSFVKYREITLLNLKNIRNKLIKSSEPDFENYSLEMRNGQSLPFWNMINGPVEDAVWHCGQIATLRRMAGNPIASEMNFLTGSVKK